MSDIPCCCSGCGKPLPDGKGNQELHGERILRFCDPCWKKRCEGELVELELFGQEEAE